jgi:hypothetical protein
MSLHKLFGFLVLAGACLLAGCGGGADGEGSSGGNSSNGSVTTVLQGQVYMAGGFVEGLTYSTATQSGTTGPKGFFKYIPGEEITFKVGNLSLKTYEIKGNARYLTHFDILGTLNPNDTEIKNLSVLLHWLDEDGDILNGIKISDSKLLVANRVNDGLQAENYQVALAAEASEAKLTLPDNLGAVLSLSTAKMRVDGLLIYPYASGSGTFNDFNSVITLSAEDSADANSDTLTYSWSIASKPKSSKAQIVNPESISPTLLVDAFDEPYIFRLAVTDSNNVNKANTSFDLVKVLVARNPISGIYSQKIGDSTRRLVAITDTGEFWGYTVSSPPYRLRKFSGPMARANPDLPLYTATPLTYDERQPCKAPCEDRVDVAANFSSERSISITNEWAKSFLFDAKEPVEKEPVDLKATTLSEEPFLIEKLEGTYREKDSGPDGNDWKITAKGEFNFYKTLSNKSTLCAIGKIEFNKQGQVLNSQGFVTRYFVPVSIEFKNECDENFDPDTLSAGYLVPDPTLGAAGYTFIGKNTAGNRYFLRHFIKQ